MPVSLIIFKRYNQGMSYQYRGRQTVGSSFHSFKCACVCVCWVTCKRQRLDVVGEVCVLVLWVTIYLAVAAHPWQQVQRLLVAWGAQHTISIHQSTFINPIHKMGTNLSKRQQSAFVLVITELSRYWGSAKQVRQRLIWGPRWGSNVSPWHTKVPGYGPYETAQQLWTHWVVLDPCVCNTEWSLVLTGWLLLKIPFVALWYSCFIHGDALWSERQLICPRVCWPMLLQGSILLMYWRVGLRLKSDSLVAAMLAISTLAWFNWIHFTLMKL